MEVRSIVIIGNGISGITAARHIRKRCDDAITVISAESEHFFSRTALMYIYMGQMKYAHIKPYEDRFWEKNRISLRNARVAEVDFEERNLSFSDGSTMEYDVLILATGSSSNRFGWPGQDFKGVQGLYSLQNLESMERDTQGIGRAVIVGGGLIGIEMAEMLATRRIPVTFLVREEGFWNNVLPKEESDMVTRHIRSHHIDLRLSTELKEITADEGGRARAVVTTAGEEIPCQFVGLTAGVHPNIDLVKNTPLETDRGILVDSFLRTNMPDVYALGDCAQHREPQAGRASIEQVWYTGRIMGETVAATVCGEPTAYRPGIWFNSAKFFDMEYQTYGTVPAQPRQGSDSLWWEHPNGKQGLRIVFDSRTKAVLGFNAMGIRLRHTVCDQWIREGAHLDQVIKNLKQADFNPEFTPFAVRY
ncbi:MAG: FAD-dependent oxidoreductase [Flavobacteriales bacterium]|nr:FAD-dependent oxidoreductase [Flavobacteriales bacterium]